MCGFVGFWHFNQAIVDSLSHTALKMAERIAHRGPDSADCWVDPHRPFVMAHRRLAIRDLSPRGAQPMVSQCGRFVMAYNGEVYNADDLVTRLHKKNIFMQGHSDTEALVNAISAFGLEETLSKINGMFAFALWDGEEKKLYLVRDRLGVKPLYFGFNRGVFYFGSELKSFFAHPGFQGEINYSAAASFFQLNFIRAPHSIFKDIYKLTPGHYVTIDAQAKVVDKRYWSLLEKAQQPPLNYCEEAQAIDYLHDLLKDAVRCRLVADVPLGAFLSGGIDSSLVVALMQAQSHVPIKTFTIGFEEAGFNEAHYARQVAQHLGTEHHELYLSARDVVQLIPELPTWYDEPFADVSALPTFLVSRLARQYVTVSLSGDGGDELFAGYNRYFLAQKICRRMALLPAALRQRLAKFILSIKPAHWNRLGHVIPAKMRPTLIGDKAHKLAKILVESNQDFYKSLLTLWPNSRELVFQPTELYPWPEINTDDFVFKMQLLDSLMYLPDDILAKVDRASMAVSLEAREPLLDYRVVEFAMRLPKHLKIRHNQGKWILRQILAQYIPPAMINRPKMGFGVPIHTWLRTSLKAWADDLLSPQKLREAHLNEALIRQRWQEHQSGARDWHYSLWGVLMYQAWCGQYGRSSV